MKMKKSHYLFMEKRIQRFLWHNSHLPQVYLSGLYPRSNKTKNLYRRYIWDIFYYSIPRDFTSNSLYPYLADSHIETALKKLIKKPEGFPE